MKLFNRQPKPKHPDLKLVFKHNGASYYTFELEKRLPFERLAESMKLIDLMSASISGVELTKALDTMNKAIMAGLQHPKNAAAIANTVFLLNERASGILHRDLLLNMAAAWTVREDEPVAKIDEKIKAEKVELFDKLAESDAHSFFLSLSIERLRHYLDMPADIFNELWMNSREKVQVFNRKLNLIEERLHKSSQTLKNS